MEPVIVWTNANLVEQGATSSFELDYDCGISEDAENNFVLLLPENIRPVANSIVYVDGTQYGGIIQERYSDTQVQGSLEWHGRTWQGILAERFVEPNSGQDYYTASGDVADCITDLISHVGLSTLFEVGECDEATISSFNYSRAHGYCNAWTGLQDLLESVNLRPTFAVKTTSGVAKVLIGATAPKTLSQEVDGESADMDMLAVFTPYNHVIGMGKGELRNRDVIHRYADVNGNISATKSITGLAERVLMYDSPSSEHDDLIQGAIDMLKEAQGEGSISVELPEDIDTHLGDYAVAYDERIEQSVTAKVSGCVVKIANGIVTCDWVAGD